MADKTDIEDPSGPGDYEGDFDPTKLYLAIISRPLEEDMADTPRTKRIPVVIDLNFKYRNGLVVAAQETIKMIEDLGRAAGRSIDREKTELSPQYVIASLTSKEIRTLAEKVYLQMDEPHEEYPNDLPREFIDRAVFMIWPDFELVKHVNKSAATVKADAAQRSFSADGSGIVWAVLDSGVDADHKHFKKHGTLELRGLDTPLEHRDFTQAGGLRNGGKTANTALEDRLGHGTHVAGIIAGEYERDPDFVENDERPFEHDAVFSRMRQTPHGKPSYQEYPSPRIAGIAPRCKIVSYKVLNDQGSGQVSNILSALAHVQKVNENGRWIRIHGVNLSVGYGFNPEWFACGQSPLCVEVNRLVRSGVVVVVSAGNSGYGTKQTRMTGNIRAGMLMTINDPGNADLAITVGSTHREMPHVFGASYFSSKGPTGDGRRKPDLLAPGERIVSCAAGKEARERRHSHPDSLKRLYLDQSGTSMAAPHVSGAIAAFLSIRREFIGQPEKVKKIFMNTATDLGRDPYMQGAGMLDLMRAIQSV